MSFGLWPWLTLVLLGAWHGLNPAMGWLFAVALGLQQRSRGAVFRALIPIALAMHGDRTRGIRPFRAWYRGTGRLVAARWWAILLGLGGWRLWRTRHPSGLECVLVSGISPVGLGLWRAHMELE